MDPFYVVLCLVLASVLPLAIDFLTSFFGLERKVYRPYQRLLVTVVIALYSLALYYFFHLVVPFFFLDASEISSYDALFVLTLSNPKAFALQAFGVWLWASTLYCYLLAVMANPIKLTAFPIEQEEFGSIFGEPLPSRVCLDCKIVRPPLTHHCKICDRCIPYFDHHCPFTGNCVSAAQRGGNYQYFILFLFYTTLGCLFVCLTTYMPFYECFYLGSPSARCQDLGLMKAVFLPGLLLFVSIASFFGFQLSLFLRSSSTVAFFTSSKRTSSASSIDLSFLQKSPLIRSYYDQLSAAIGKRLAFTDITLKHIFFPFVL